MDWENWRVHYRRLAMECGLKFAETGNNFWIVYNSTGETTPRNLNAKARAKKSIGISLTCTRISVTSGELEEYFQGPDNDKDFETIKKILKAEDIVIIDGKPHIKELKELEL